MKILNIICLALVIIGGLNWLLVGAIQFNLVEALFGPATPLTRAVYCLVGLAAIYCLTFFRYLDTYTRVTYTTTPSTTNI